MINKYGNALNFRQIILILLLSVILVLSVSCQKKMTKDEMRSEINADNKFSDFITELGVPRNNNKIWDLDLYNFLKNAYESSKGHHFAASYDISNRREQLKSFDELEKFAKEEIISWFGERISVTISDSIEEKRVNSEYFIKEIYTKHSETTFGGKIEQTFSKEYSLKNKFRLVIVYLPIKGFYRSTCRKIEQSEKKIEALNSSIQKQLQSGFSRDIINKVFQISTELSHYEMAYSHKIVLESHYPELLNALAEKAYISDVYDTLITEIFNRFVILPVYNYEKNDYNYADLDSVICGISVFVGFKIGVSDTIPINQLDIQTLWRGEQVEISTKRETDSHGIAYFELPWFDADDCIISVHKEKILLNSETTGVWSDFNWIWDLYFEICVPLEQKWYDIPIPWEKCIHNTSDFIYNIQDRLKHNINVIYFNFSWKDSGVFSDTAVKAMGSNFKSKLESYLHKHIVDYDPFNQGFNSSKVELKVMGSGSPSSGKECKLKIICNDGSSIDNHTIYRNINWLTFPDLKIYSYTEKLIKLSLSRSGGTINTNSNPMGLSISYDLVNTSGQDIFSNPANFKFTVKHSRSEIFANLYFIDSNGDIFILDENKQYLNETSIVYKESYFNNPTGMYIFWAQSEQQFSTMKADYFIKDPRYRVRKFKNGISGFNKWLCENSSLNHVSEQVILRIQLQSIWTTRHGTWQ